MKKIIAIVVVILIGASTIIGLAQTLKKHTKEIESKRSINIEEREKNNMAYLCTNSVFDEVIGMYRQEGIIKSVNFKEGRVMLMAENFKKGYEVIITMGIHTRVETNNGYELEMGNISPGSPVVVYYDRLYEAEGNVYAEAKRVIATEYEDTIGIVSYISKEGNHGIIEVGNNYDNRTDMYLVEEDTVIENIYGESIEFNYLKVGMEVKILSKMVLNKIDNEIEALKIIVDVPNTDGIIKEVYKDRYSSTLLIGCENCSKELVLHIDTNSHIVDENNKKINIEDLKSGMKVKAYYDLVMKKDELSISKGNKIEVKNSVELYGFNKDLNLTGKLISEK